MIPNSYIWRGNISLKKEINIEYLSWHDRIDSIIADFFLKPEGNLTIFSDIVIPIGIYCEYRSSIFIKCSIEIGRNESDSPIRKYECGTEEFYTSDRKYYDTHTFTTSIDEPLFINTNDHLRVILYGGWINNPKDPVPLDRLSNQTMPCLVMGPSLVGSKISMKINPISIQHQMIDDNIRDNEIEYHFDIQNSISEISKIQFEIRNTQNDDYSIFEETIHLDEPNPHYSSSIRIDHSLLTKTLIKNEDFTNNRYKICITVFDTEKSEGNDVEYYLEKDITLIIDITDLSEEKEDTLHRINLYTVIAQPLAMILGIIAIILVFQIRFEKKIFIK